MRRRRLWPADNVTAAVFVPDPAAPYRSVSKAEVTGVVRFSTGATRVTDSGWRGCGSFIHALHYATRPHFV